MSVPERSELGPMIRLNGAVASRTNPRNVALQARAACAATQEMAEPRVNRGSALVPIGSSRCDLQPTQGATRLPAAGYAHVRPLSDLRPVSGCGISPIMEFCSHANPCPRSLGATASSQDRRKRHPTASPTNPDRMEAR